VVRNYNTLLGQDGITGLKTGSDTAAGGCILLAAWQQARGHDALIVAATFGQPGTMATMLPTALQAGHQLVLALGRALAGQSAQHLSGNKAGKHPRTARHRARATARSGGRVMTRHSGLAQSFPTLAGTMPGATTRPPPPP
jgi:D-alanyl-D-alanine carboxypeptidase